MGVMGGATAKALSMLGYKVSAWTRRPRDSADGVNVECFSGKEQFRTFCSQSDILVCLLPLTAETTGILNRDVFSLLPRGSAVINAARGKHLVVDDLIESLDSGHLRAAILDVFEKEPLSANSPLWSHPKVRIFPHVSSMTNIESGVEQILQNRNAVLGIKGSVPSELVVDVHAGY